MVQFEKLDVLEEEGDQFVLSLYAIEGLNFQELVELFSGGGQFDFDVFDESVVGGEPVSGDGLTVGAILGWEEIAVLAGLAISLSDAADPKWLLRMSILLFFEDVDCLMISLYDITSHVCS